MFDFLQIDTSLLISSIVLVAMGCVALFYSLTLRHKLRGLRKIRNISVGVYDKTFNVLDTSAPHRKMINSHTGLIVFIAVYGSWFVITVTVFKAFQVGAILGAVTFLICAGLLMLDETQELNSAAATFLKAVQNGTGLGKGDLQALAALRSMLPRLSGYHLVLAIVFFSSSIAFPYITDVVFLGAGTIAWPILALSGALTAVPMLSLLVIAAFFAAAIILVQTSVWRARKKILGFPTPVPIDVEGRQFFRMRMFAGIMHHHPTIHVPEPEDTENINRKEIEEHSNS